MSQSEGGIRHSKFIDFTVRYEAVTTDQKTATQNPDFGVYYLQGLRLTSPHNSPAPDADIINRRYLAVLNPVNRKAGSALTQGTPMLWPVTRNYNVI